MVLIRLLSCFLFLLSSSQITAQADVYTRFALPDNTATEIKSPQAFLGYQLGERFTEYDPSVRYFKYLAEQSSRINIEQYGETYEARPLLLLTVSSEENLERINEILMTQQALVAGEEVAEENLARHPVINGYSYNIHGNEASSTEAAMQFAYELATTQNPEILTALDNTVNLLFVCINPDGRTRYVTWYNGVNRATGGESPADLEHHAPWPNGRTNHYWFDLNRDWIWGIHPESRGHIAAYQRWMPSVHTDYHEQGYDQNYFTVPGTTPRNLILPERLETWSDTFGRANAAAFDARGISYFTRERFDFYYPSYGSSYPSVMGGIGMLTEQGGIAAGTAVETNDGYVLTLRQRIFDHYLTSVEQLKVAARNRAELIKYSRRAWDPLSSKVPTTAYVLVDDGNEYLEDVLDILLRNGVVVEMTTEPLTVEGISFRDGQSDRRTFPKNSYIVSTEQPRHLFINSLLGRQLPIEDSVMYDMSSWSAPLAYNLEAYALEGAVRVKTVPHTRRDSADLDPIWFSSEEHYGYAIPWNQRNAPGALAELWRRGVKVRAAKEPFTQGKKLFAAGTLVILKGRNRDLNNQSNLSIDDIVAQVGSAFGLEYSGLKSGRVDEGRDLASSSNFPLRQPRVALLVEPPFDTYTSGQLYWLFDYETRLPVDRIRASLLSETSIPKFGSRYGYPTLDDYDVLILPNTNKLASVFQNDDRRKLLDWLDAGGTLIAIGQSAEFFTNDSRFVTAQPLVQPGPDTAEKVNVLNYDERTEYYGKRRIPGAALRSTVDTSNPLAFGLPDGVFTLKFGSKALKPNPGLYSVARYHESPDSLLTAGYANRENLEILAGNTWAGFRRVGNRGGKIVYFMDNPHYRMFWRGPSRMMLNAVMILPSE